MSALRPQRGDRSAFAQLVNARAIWCSCEECGGVAVRVRDRRIAGSTLAPAGECPHCETHRRRGEAPQESPQVWYDTLISDWVVQLPVDPDGPVTFGDPVAPAWTVVLPLEV